MAFGKVHRRGQIIAEINVTPLTDVFLVLLIIFMVTTTAIAEAGKDEGGFKVNVDMTLTAPGCGMGPAIAEDAKGKILLVPGVSTADVRITWDPPWNQSMISEEGKMKLGLI